MNVCIWSIGKCMQKIHNFMPTELHQLRWYLGHSSQCFYHVSSAEAKSWWLQTQIRLQGGNSFDMMAENTRHSIN